MLVSGWPAEKVRTDERIKEIAFGDWEGKAPRTLGDDFAPFFADPAHFVPAPGDESLPALMARVSDFVAYVKQSHRGQTVLAVSHGAALHALLTAELGLDMKDYWAWATAPPPSWSWRASALCSNPPAAPPARTIWKNT